MTVRVNLVLKAPEEDCCCRQCQFELLGSKFYSPILSVFVVVVFFSLPTTGGLGGGRKFQIRS